MLAARERGGASKHSQLIVDRTGRRGHPATPTENVGARSVVMPFPAPNLEIVSRPMGPRAFFILFFYLGESYRPVRAHPLRGRQRRPRGALKRRCDSAPHLKLVRRAVRRPVP